MPYERNGEQRGDGDEDIALISAGDIRNGPRHIKGLREIELRSLIAIFNSVTPENKIADVSISIFKTVIKPQ